MKKNTQDYIDRNNKKYAYYIRNTKGKIMAACSSGFVIAGIGLLVFFIRDIFLEREALAEAGTQCLGNTEVMDWVANRVEEQRFNGNFWYIAGLTIVMAVVAIIVNLFVKSYHLYKMRWLKWFPTALTILLLFILGAEYGSEYFLLIIVTAIELIPLSFNFITLLPLEIREEYSWLIKFTSCLSQVIIKHL